jgi:hypothetical protein
MSKRNNESTQQNRRIVRWSRRHVQSRRNVREDGRSSTQSDIENFQNTPKPRPKSSVVVCRKPHILRQYYRQNGQMWSSIVFNGDNFGVGYSDVDGSVAAMKAHLEKYIINTKDPNTCIRCERVDKGSVASTVSPTCSKCYVKACYSSGSYDCPECQLVCQTYRLSDPIAPHQSGSRLHDRHLTEDEGSEKDVHGRRHTGRQHTVCDSIGVISSDPRI